MKDSKVVVMPSKDIAAACLAVYEGHDEAWDVVLYNMWQDSASRRPAGSLEDHRADQATDLLHVFQMIEYARINEHRSSAAPAWAPPLPSFHATSSWWAIEREAMGGFEDLRFLPRLAVRLHHDCQVLRNAHGREHDWKLLFCYATSVCHTCLPEDVLQGKRPERFELDRTFFASLHGVVQNHSLWLQIPSLGTMERQTPRDILHMPLVQALFPICFAGCQLVGSAHYEQLRKSSYGIRLETVPPALEILPLRWTRSSDGLNLRKMLADGVKAGALGPCPLPAGEYTVADWQREYVVFQHKRPAFALALVHTIWEEYRPLLSLSDAQLRRRLGVLSPTSEVTVGDAENSAPTPARRPTSEVPSRPVPPTFAIAKRHQLANFLLRRQPLFAMKHHTVPPAKKLWRRA